MEENRTDVEEQETSTIAGIVSCDVERTLIELTVIQSKLENLRTDLNSEISDALQYLAFISERLRQSQMKDPK